MLQTLFYIPNDIHGIPVFGFGILLLLIALITVVSMILSIRKHGGFTDDAWGYVPLSILAIIIVVFICPAVSEKQGLPIRGYGVMLLVAISAAAGLLIYRAKKLWNIPPDLIFTFGITSLIFGLIGTRVFHIIQYWDRVKAETLQKTLLNMIDVTQGGLVVYGGIIGGTLAAVIYLKMKKLPLLATLDVAAPALALGIAFGRIGCLLNGCCFGNVCDASWAITFPPLSSAHVHQLNEEHLDLFVFGLKFKDEKLPNGIDTIIVTEVEPGSEAEEKGMKAGMSVHLIEFKHEGKFVRFKLENRDDLISFLLQTAHDNGNLPVLFVIGTPPGEITAENPEGKSLYRDVSLSPGFEVRPVHPTQIYSSINAFVICMILLILTPFFKRDGLLTVTFFGLYAITRFGLEIIRTDEAPFFAGMTISQNVSVLVLSASVLAGIVIMILPAQHGYEGMFPKEEKS